MTKQFTPVITESNILGGFRGMIGSHAAILQTEEPAPCPASTPTPAAALANSARACCVGHAGKRGAHAGVLLPHPPQLRADITLLLLPPPPPQLHRIISFGLAGPRKWRAGEVWRQRVDSSSSSSPPGRGRGVRWWRALGAGRRRL